MTNTEIDPTTGLPALPEGFFWRVQQTRTFFGYYAVAVHLMEKNVTTTRTNFNSDYRKRTWFERLLRKPEMSRYNEVESIEDISTRHSFVYDSDGDPLTRGTREQIREAAIKVYEDWTLEKESDSLLGDYPPKTLGE